MGNIYDRFRKLEKEAGEEWFLDELRLVTFEDDGKNTKYISQENAQINILSFIVKTTQ